MTSKYIKAKTIIDFINDCLEHEDKITDIEKATLYAIKKLVKRTPAANVALVRYGRWVEQHSDFDLCGIVYYECSECKREQQVKSYYCPNCGARMDGG